MADLFDDMEEEAEELAGVDDAAEEDEEGEEDVDEDDGSRGAAFQGRSGFDHRFPKASKASLPTATLSSTAGAKSTAATPS